MASQSHMWRIQPKKCLLCAGLFGVATRHLEVRRSSCPFVDIFCVFFFFPIVLFIYFSRRHILFIGLLIACVNSLTSPPSEGQTVPAAISSFGDGGTPFDGSADPFTDR